VEVVKYLKAAGGNLSAQNIWGWNMQRRLYRPHRNLIEALRDILKVAEPVTQGSFSGIGDV
jgi:hypothetical protein